MPTVFQPTLARARVTLAPLQFTGVQHVSPCVKREESNLEAQAKHCGDSRRAWGHSNLADSLDEPRRSERQPAERDAQGRGLDGDCAAHVSLAAALQRRRSQL